MAFKLSGILSLDNKGFMRGITQAESASGKLSKSVNSAKGSIKGFIGAAAGIAGISFGIHDIISTFSNFEKEMSNVQAITEETSEVAMKNLSEKAKEMGRILPASASDAAQAMANLGSAGFTTNEIMDSIEGTLYLATAAQVDMATAADIASSTLRGFGLEAKNAGHVADVLALTASKTNAGITDLGEAMKYAAPVSKALSISLEETSAAIGLMSNAGIKGSQAGTTLRGALIRLTKPAKPAKEAMQELGFSAFDTEGKMKPLSVIMGELQNKTKNLTQEQKNNKIATIFGTEALSGMLALMDAGPTKIDELTKSLAASDGASKKMAETQTNNLYGAMQELEGAFETAKINIGEQAAPALTKAIKGIAEVLPTLAEEGLKKVNEAFAWLEEHAGGVDGVITSVKDTFAAFSEILNGDFAPAVNLTADAIDNLFESFTNLLYEWKSSDSALKNFIAGGVGTLAPATGISNWTKDRTKAIENEIGKNQSNFKQFLNDPSLGSFTNFILGAPEKNANGTQYFKGGTSLVNERGGELMSLPNGTTIIPADRSKDMVNGSRGVQITIENMNVSNEGMSINEFVNRLELVMNNM